MKILWTHFLKSKILLCLAFWGQTVFVVACQKQNQGTQTHLTIAGGANAFLEQGIPGAAESDWVIQIEVSLPPQGQRTSPSKSTCTGSLITPVIVLTTAHCLDAGRSAGHSVPQEVSAASVTIVAKTANGKEMRYSAKRLSLHEKYAPTLLSGTEGTTMGGDLGLIELESPVAERFTRNLPIIVTGKDLLVSLGISGKPVSFFGYGRTQWDPVRQKASRQDYSRRVGVNITMDFASCQEAEQKLVISSGKNTQSAAKTSNYQGGGAFCLHSRLDKNSSPHLLPGDSGGPATVYWQGRHYLVGVASTFHTDGCKKKKMVDKNLWSYFAVLTSPDTIDWINRFMGKNLANKD